MPHDLMMSVDFYRRPMVVRLTEIFGNPVKPKTVVQEQFDGAQLDLESTAAKAWHEIDQSDYWHYLLDLCYVDLQPDLFDYLFPAFLIRWWEGQLTRMGGPESECDFYRAIDRGNVLAKMMDEVRREKVLAWMVDAYMEGVAAWGGHLSVVYDSHGPDNLHGPLWSFHALGQSVPISASILDRLSDIRNEGIAQWWLVLAMGLAWKDNECPPVPPWTPAEGGGGIYVVGSAASIYDHGYLEENLRAVRAQLTVETLVERLNESIELFGPSSPHGNWARETLRVIQGDQNRVAERLNRFHHLLSLPDLGGILDDPL